MKNQFLKFVPATLVAIAIALLFIPKTVSYLDVEKFFADTDPYYQRAASALFKRSGAKVEDYYYPGVHIGKLWKKIGVGAHLASKEAWHAPLRDAYLFGCSYAAYTDCVLPYPVVREYAFGDYRALRVSSDSLRFPDYQYLLFKSRSDAWVYFGHIDVFDNNKADPSFKLMDNGLASVVSVAGSGEGYLTKFVQIYRLDGASVRLLLALPSEARRAGIGLLDFDVKASVVDGQEGLTADYTITFAAGNPDRKGVKALPLFTLDRRVVFKARDGQMVYDPAHSNITPAEMTKIVAGSYARIYRIFRSEFDKLERSEGVKKEWFARFLSVVRDEGLPLEPGFSAPRSGSHQP